MIEAIETYSLPFFAVLLVGDLTLRALGFARAYDLRDSLCSATMGAFYAVTSVLVRVPALLALSWLSTWALFSFGADDGPVVWIAAYVLVDFAFYWFHRTVHEVRLGWAAHVNHHSSQHYNYATALRQSFVEPFIEPFFLAPVVLLGFEPVLVVACLALNFVYQFWPHTELGGQLATMGRFLVTPSHHRVHHAANVQYLDKNYGGTLIVWDKLFGTFEPEREKPAFGITHNIGTHNPVRATLHEWISIARDLATSKNLREVGGYLFQPPGWAPEGPGQTSRERQRNARLSAQKGQVDRAVGSL